MKTTTIPATLAFLGLSVSALVAQVPVADDRSVRALVEDLVMEEQAAAPLSIAQQLAGETGVSEDYKKRFEKCRRAFKKLTELKKNAFPVLTEHLGDKRPSITFGDLSKTTTVGDACYTNIHFQLVEVPARDPRFEIVRLGRDGRPHLRPNSGKTPFDPAGPLAKFLEAKANLTEREMRISTETPFDAAGGLAKWLEANARLTHTEMRIKCLDWLLDREKEIGANDAEGYFINIMPIEIRILEIRKEAGEDVGKELDRMRIALAGKDPAVVPPSLLPPPKDVSGKPK
ncbi:hypothetical protein JIN84_06050 [Luteolibacter yonseiensis]|uniref:Secreted protein n=1 Tax=Luteolibacter yonseiensis TaxID=1144680 RepID=A0A934VAH7_9BACT|nr:hypothetical protein [Luteolibacter yonseiensis]MBK1815165.1 hypothetical protein [Luteolibacter yonseiensis]